MKENKIFGYIFAVVLIFIFIYSLFLSRPTYKVTFNTNGGTTIDYQAIKKNDVVVKPEDPEREGYTFKEWQVNGATYDFETKITSATNITAVWEAKVYTIKFDSNGGSKVSSQEVKHDEVITKPSNPTRKNYKFVEWQVNGETYDFTKTITGDMTLKAKWKKS